MGVAEAHPSVEANAIGTEKEVRDSTRLLCSEGLQLATGYLANKQAPPPGSSQRYDALGGACRWRFLFFFREGERAREPGTRRRNANEQ